MKIITAPHDTLRAKAVEIKQIDKKVVQFIKNLEQTLYKKENPKGVGLAAPQVDKKLRAFATFLPLDGDFESKNSQFETQAQIRHFINPTITKHSGKQVFGEKRDEPQLEGCLSIPKIYGPVPRWEWVELEYSFLKDGKLIEQRERFEGFAARVIQHENDHLDGILFTDYLLEYDLPLYLENKKTGKLEESTNREIIEVL